MTTKKTQAKTTVTKSGFASATIHVVEETDAERHLRQKEIAMELYRKRHSLDSKVSKVATATTPDTTNMTIEQEDYWYRKEMREAMEEDDCDMFSYNW